MQNNPLLFQCKIQNVQFGENVKIIEPCNIYECTIGNNVFIGPFTEIQKDVFIGDNTKVQSHSFICELVTIGENCFIGHGVMFINDKFKKDRPAQGEKDLWCKTNIGNNVSIGSNCTILPVNICDNTVVGAGTVVTKNIEVAGVYAGNPARLLRKI